MELYQMILWFALLFFATYFLVVRVTLYRIKQLEEERLYQFEMRLKDRCLEIKGEGLDDLKELQRLSKETFETFRNQIKESRHGD